MHTLELAEPQPKFTKRVLFCSLRRVGYKSKIHLRLFTQTRQEKHNMKVDLNVTSNFSYIVMRSVFESCILREIFEDLHVGRFVSIVEENSTNST